VIPAASITAWGTARPWPSRAAIEQDLLLARTIVAIYEHPDLCDELVFRGGTCLHQVHLGAPRRYSEDLDFVRSTHSGIGPVFDALREVASRVGLVVARTDIGEHPKMMLRGASEDDPTLPLRVKVEINTHETSPARPLVRLPFAVTSDWFTGSADVLTFTPAELVCTKLRALYQRSKGRDLFDLWLALTELHLVPAEILGCFGHYRPAGYTAWLAMKNLDAKLQNRTFVTDLELLVASWPVDYDVASAARLVRDELLAHL
jgi:hypothetical protein